MSTVRLGGRFTEEMWPAGMPHGNEAKILVHWLWGTSISDKSVVVQVNLPGNPCWGFCAGHPQDSSLGHYQLRTTTLGFDEIWPSSPARPSSTTIHSLCVTYADWIKHYFKHPHLWGTKITPSSFPFQHESHPRTEKCSFLWLGVGVGMEWEPLTTEAFTFPYWDVPCHSSPRQLTSAHIIAIKNTT